jgi:hypothetical protein
MKRRISLIAQSLSACLRLDIDTRANPDRYTPAQRKSSRKLGMAAKSVVSYLLGPHDHTQAEASEILGVSREGWREIERMLKQ